MDNIGREACKIREGNAMEMCSLWYKKHTSEFFARHMETKNALFWTLECEGKLLGELYVFKKLPDKDFADGKTTAYLCAFRIHPSFRGQGYGTKLLEHALGRLRKEGFSYATIGCEIAEEANMRLYRRSGFLKTVKTVCVDLCDVDEHGKPLDCEPYALLRKKI